MPILRDSKICQGQRKAAAEKENSSAAWLIVHAQTASARVIRCKFQDTRTRSKAVLATTTTKERDRPLLANWERSGGAIQTPCAWKGRLIVQLDSQETVAHQTALIIPVPRLRDVCLALELKKGVRGNEGQQVHGARTALIGIGTPDRRYNSSLLLTQVTNEQRWFAGPPGKAI
ncbi:unnamed protein product [Clonostachys rhizophaga]|uniref:Uncharacterized protein n=1 Tax=Clonostachys rhizophaga TaxID=160324 RepID=A0A9N9V1U4_9HYPO|nr:unnamed protein product [Clonostachys rhizophaga]